LPGDRDNIAAELGWVGLGHDDIFPAKTNLHRSGVNQTGGSPNHLFVKDFRPIHPTHYVTIFLTNASKGAEKFTVERLRSTWLVEHLKGGTEPFALMAAAGVKSFSTFERLAEYVPLPSGDRLTAMFRRDFRDV
ncbi:hypothetical protein, partial [Cryobacterium sp.]|uniref:hypothetical protein n=1 Tax=Cryobacterium sp. TaxID=1926290 RepID=UPI002632A138